MDQESNFRKFAAEAGYGRVDVGRFDRGQTITARAREEDFSALLLEGELELTTPNGAVVLHPGDTWSFAAGVVFGERVLGADPVRFLFATRRFSD